ncbi:MAG: zinc ribbon domain-containing protein [Treponema sp.]|jgi:hypothetical protein|nr:zinc ribbon domain-containing protein [Treponema sp.]
MSELVRYCGKCGARLVDKAAVCVKCGHRVPSANFRTAGSVSKNRNNSKKTNSGVILGIYGFSGALGVFCALVPAIGAIIIGICFNLIYAGIILILAGGIYLLAERGLFGGAFIIVGILAAIFIALYRFGLIGDITAYIQKIKTFSF